MNALMRLATFLHPKKPSFRSSGRWRTCDAAMKSQRTSLLQQETEWLERSCLGPKDLPGRVQPAKNGRTIEFFDIDGKRLPHADVLRRFRPERGFAAQTEAANEEPEPKYLHPAGQPPHLYYPQNGGNHWRAWAKDAKQQKIFVEGCAKAACANKFKFPAVGIEGCWGWRAVKHGLLMLPEFNDYEFENCDVYWVPDRDRKPQAVADILRASNAFAGLLRERGARVHVVWLPLIERFGKVGIDDFLFHYSRAGKDARAARAAFEEQIAATPVWEDFEISDLGNARRWISMYGARFRYVGGRRGSWLVYRDGCWREDSQLECQETSKQMFDGLLQDAAYAGNADRLKLLRAHVTAQRVENVPRMAKSDPAVIVTPEQLDRQPLLVNCKNGTLELPNDARGKLHFREASPDDLLTRAAAVNWNPKAVCPHFLDALNFWTKGDRELQRTIQQLLGLSATGITREQVFIILHGPGATGKSTLIEIVHEALGNYAVVLSSETFLVRRFGAPEERKVAPLPGARFASSSETEQGGIMDENLIKQLTGEDSMVARLLYEEQFNFRPQAKIWLRTNNKPEIRGTGNDIWRRVVALPFGQVIPPERRDKFLKQKLQEELEGIFAWMVRGYCDYAQNGLALAPVVLADIEQYRKEQDVLERFFDAECEFGKDLHVGREALYIAFRSWCERVKVRTVPGVKSFKQELTARFQDRVREKQLWVTDSKQKRKQEWRWVGVDTKANINMQQLKTPKF